MDKENLANINIDVTDKTVNSTVEGSTNYVLIGLASTLATVIREAIDENAIDGMLEAFVRDVKENLELQNKKHDGNFKYKFKL